MAKLKGLLKMEGTLNELIFYKTQDGYLVRSKGGISAQRIANDANFQRTRESGAEFGRCSTAGKWLRSAVSNLLVGASDNRVISRLTQVMIQIKNYDTTSARGERKVAVGIANPVAPALLKGFDFNEKAALSAVLSAPFTVAGATGAINIPALVPSRDVVFPSGVTHIGLKSAYVVVDFSNGNSAIEYSPIINLPVDGINRAVTLTPSGVPAGEGTKFYLLLIEFFQEINGVQCSLKDGGGNVLTIVDVA